MRGDERAGDRQGDGSSSASGSGRSTRTGKRAAPPSYRDPAGSGSDTEEAASGADQGGSDADWSGEEEGGEEADEAPDGVRQAPGHRALPRLGEGLDSDEEAAASAASDGPSEHEDAYAR